MSTIKALNKNQTKVTNFYTKKKQATSTVKDVSSAIKPNAAGLVPKSPKRNLPPPTAEESSPKKKPMLEVKAKPVQKIPVKIAASKQDKKQPARRKLQLQEKESKPKKNPEGKNFDSAQKSIKTFLAKTGSSSSIQISVKNDQQSELKAKVAPEKAAAKKKSAKAAAKPAAAKKTEIVRISSSTSHVKALVEISKPGPSAIGKSAATKKNKTVCVSSSSSQVKDLIEISKPGLSAAAKPAVIKKTKTVGISSSSSQVKELVEIPQSGPSTPEKPTKKTKPACISSSSQVKEIVKILKPGPSNLTTLKAKADAARLKTLKEKLAQASAVIEKSKEQQNNKFKISYIAAPQGHGSLLSALPDVPAHMRYRNLVEPLEAGPSLAPPYQYKVLADTFCSMDTVVSILHNRKEKVTFDKVKEGVQKMTKQTFTKDHLGQMLTVLPSAYTLSVEKCSNFTKKSSRDEHQIVIVPNLCQDKVETSKKGKASFVCMTPQFLMQRKQEFNDNLLTIVKKYHEEFLIKIRCPPVPDECLMHWHPKFYSALLPTIASAPMPELPEAKICTAKDVLNNIKCTLYGKKIEKALQAVSESQTPQQVTVEIVDSPSVSGTPKQKITKSSLSGICGDLLERIRAKESAKCLETMTRPPSETKRLAMMERLPKIVEILWHFFVSERKSAISLDAAVEKIIYSFNSLTTPDSVKEHLKLIAESFPGWISFVEVSKGTYITMDKRKDIYTMLENFRY